MQAHRARLPGFVLGLKSERRGGRAGCAQELAG